MCSFCPRPAACLRVHCVLFQVLPRRLSWRVLDPEAFSPLPFFFPSQPACWPSPACSSSRPFLLPFPHPSSLAFCRVGHRPPCRHGSEPTFFLVSSFPRITGRVETLCAQANQSFADFIGPWQRDPCPSTNIPSLSRSIYSPIHTDYHNIRVKNQHVRAPRIHYGRPLLYVTLLQLVHVVCLTRTDLHCVPFRYPS